MNSIQVQNDEIEIIEKLLLPESAHFPDDAKSVIKCWESTDVSACPGSGKTTVLLAKLKILADRMPLDNGEGVCVLSHTNVAVNEIKTRLSSCADKLLNYPNYVGTIQSFIDLYIVKPYLKRKTTATLQVVDDDVFSFHLLSLIYKTNDYPKLRGLLKNNFNKEIYPTILDMVKSLYLKDEALYLGRQARPLAGKGTKSSTQYILAIENLLKNEGMIRYKDAYRYAEEAIAELSDKYVELFSRRFKYVFIDEYQDCDVVQRRALDKIFDKTKACVLHIGDPDQAIYNSDVVNQEDWSPSESALSIATSNRYGQQIADVINHLKKREGNIISAESLTSCKPTLIVFDDDTRNKVINTFIGILKSNDLVASDGIYKVVGAVKKKSLAGLKISDYWEDFDPSGKHTSENNYWNYIQAITMSLEQGKGYLAELNIRKLLCKILNYLGKKYTIHSIKEKLDNTHFETYKMSILKIFELSEYTKDIVDAEIKNMVNALITSANGAKTVWDELPKYFLEDIYSCDKSIKHHNSMYVPSDNITIQFDTVHGVKGETHDATLYLETEKGGTSDIKKVLPFFIGGKHTKTADYSRKCVYVGMSRPRKLLCLAIHKKTYEISKNTFDTWNVIECE